MDDRPNFDSSQLALLRQQVAELEARKLQLQTECASLAAGRDLAGRQRGEEVPRQSEERYRMLVEMAADAIILFSQEGIIIEANQQLSSMLGMAGSDFIGRHIRELPFSPESLRDKPFRFDLLQKGETVITERTLIRLNGEEITVEMRTRMMPDGAYQSIGRDITERKQAEERLKKSEAKYCDEYTLMRLLCDNVPDMIWAKDLEKRYLFANKAFCRDLLIAADTEEPIGKTDMFFAERERALHADDPQWHTFGEICGETDTLTMEAGIPQQFDEYGNVRGKFLFLDVHKVPFRDENGTMIGTVGSARDVTLVKEMERKLKESEERLKLALFGADLATWDWHIPSGTAMFNDRWAEILGYTPEEVEPHVRSWQTLVHPDDLPYVTRVLNEHCEGRTESYTSAHRLRHKSGEWIWVLDKGRVIERDAQGKPLRACGTHLDITAHKRAEEEKKNLRAQLIQAQKMEAIGTLAGGIAHDFNNILSAILGYAELALDGSPAGSLVAKDLTKVVEAGQRATTLVKQILAFSRQHDTERIPLKPAYIVKEAIKLLRPSLPSTIAIRQQVDTATKPILADPTQIHQILMNLCTNAFHAMEQTGGTLEITLADRELSPGDLQRHPEASGCFVVLSIGDTGTGIGPEIRDKIFDPYFTTKAVGKGTGMGLAIIHGIVSSYGGFITCASKLGEGALFQVFFPALEMEIITEAKPVEAAPPGKERILLIDDEEMVAGLGKTMLERLGYEVTVRTSSPEALAAFEKQPERFDAVITDQTMPGMTGMDLARRMLQLRPDLPIILCTGYSALINEEQIRALGIKAFAMKPLAKKDIAELLRKVLDERILPDQGLF